MNSSFVIFSTLTRDWYIVMKTLYSSQNQIIYFLIALKYYYSFTIKDRYSYTRQQKEVGVFSKLPSSGANVKSDLESSLMYALTYLYFRCEKS